MRLQNLRERLYAKESDIESRKPQSDVYDPRSKINEGTPSEGEKKDQSSNNEEWVIETGTTKRQKTLMLLIFAIVGGVVAVGLSAFLIYKYIMVNPQQELVKLQIEVPPSVNLNEEITINVSYANNNRVGIKDAHLTVETPPNFKISGTNPQADSTNKFSAEWSIPEIGSQKSGVLELKGRFNAKEEGTSSFRAVLGYMFANVNSPFQKEVSASTQTVGLPLGLSVDATREVANNYALRYNIFVKNNGKDPFQNIQVNLTYPPGFSLTSNSSPLEGLNKDVWKIPTILSGEEKTITIEGKIEGKSGEQKILNAKLGMNDSEGFKEYVEKDAITTITEPPITITQKIEDGNLVVHKGDMLNFNINFTNNSERAIGKAIVKAKIEGDIFDWKNISPGEGGWFDLNNKEIVWQGGKVASLNNLNPGESGKLTYRLKVADFIPFSLTKKSNFSGKITVSIDSPEMPTPVGQNKIIIGNSIELKLSTLVNLKSTGFYSDGTIPNNGPIPPTVGKKTTYTVHWVVANAFNDLKGVEVKTILPYGVEWMDKVSPSKNGVEYRERTREVIWNLERIPAGAGGDTPAASLVFQVGVTPTENDVGKKVDILGETTLKGTDSFTQETISATAPGIDSSLPNDESINNEMGTVIRPGDKIDSEYDFDSGSKVESTKSTNENNNKNK